jgi:hypothetical protein
MSTGPGPTRKADGTADASVDDIADLLVEDDPSSNQAASEEVSEDNLEVMLETPGPVLANPFMPPPPSPLGDSGDAGEEGENSEEGGAATNLAYEDLLAKLVLPAKAPEPEPAMPALMSSLPLPDSDVEPITPSATPYILPSSPSLLSAPPSDESTLVTENPLVAEEQQAAYREGRMGIQPPNAVQQEQQAALTEPVAPVNGAAKSRLFYLMAGGGLVLFGMFLAVVVLKMLMPTPAPPPPAMIAPAPLPPPPPPSAPPAHVEPLPPSAPAAVAPPAPAAPVPGAAPENPAAIPDTVPGVEPERPAPRPHRVAHPKPARLAVPKAVAAPKPAPAPKPAAAPKPAPAPAPAAKAPKAPAAKKPGKASGYADPFDN